MIAVLDSDAWVPCPRRGQHVAVQRFATLVREVLLEPENDVDGPEAIREEGERVVSEQLRVQCLLMMDCARNRAQGLYNLPIRPVLEVDALEDD